jgi:hypothetical protein
MNISTDNHLTRLTKEHAAIPVTGGFNPVNGLPMQAIICIVYDAKSFNIIGISDTHNKADEIANHFYRQGVDARSDEVRYFSESLQPADLIGMNLGQFAWFLEQGFSA